MNLKSFSAKLHTLDGVTDQTQIKVGVGVIVLDKRGYLLLEKRADCGLWGLLGGKIDPGESILGTTEREIREESGLEIQQIKLIGVYSDPKDRIVEYPSNGDHRHLIDIIMSAEIKSGEIEISEESEELRFFDPSALPTEEEIITPARRPLQDFLEKRKEVIA